MQIELRKIHYSAQLSEETSAYTAQVWVDGKHVVDVKNDGHGGSDMQYPIPPFTYGDLKALNERIRAEFPPLDMSKYGMEPIPADLEHVCGDLLAAHLIERDVKRIMRSKVLFVADGKVREVGFKGMRTLTPEALQKGIAVAKQKYPDAKVLNTLPLQEAVAAFRAAT